MSLSIKKTKQSVGIRDTGGRPCGTYHYEDMFKSFFRGLYSPSGKDVVACPPVQDPHHKGLQFGLCTSAANFWEEDEANEPDTKKLPIGKQQTTKLERLSQGIGFTQQILWMTDEQCIFVETRKISVEEAPKAYVWTWQTTFVVSQDVQIIKSVWGVPSYCGLGLRLASELFQEGEVRPLEAKCGTTPTWVSFRGKGVEVKFEQDASQANALFLSTYQTAGFAFMSLVPKPCELKQGASLELRYVITVSDF